MRSFLALSCLEKRGVRLLLVPPLLSLFLAERGGVLSPSSCPNSGIGLPQQFSLWRLVSSSSSSTPSDSEPTATELLLLFVGMGLRGALSLLLLSVLLLSVLLLSAPLLSATSGEIARGADAVCVEGTGGAARAYTAFLRWLSLSLPASSSPFNIKSKCKCLRVILVWWL